MAKKRGAIVKLHLFVIDEVYYFTSSYIIGTGYQDFPFLWYNYGTKIVFLSHIFTGNTFKELFAKVRKIFETQGSFDVFISTLDGRLSGCPLSPIHPEFFTPIDRDVPDWFPRGPTFEKTYGFLKMVSGSSGCLVASPRKRPTSFRGSICFDRLHRCPTGVHRWGRWSLVGWVLVDWVCTWGLLGMGGGKVSIIHITNNVLNFRRVLMARPVRLRTRRRESPSLNSAISSPYCIR